VQGLLGYAYALAGQRQNAEAMMQQLTARGGPDGLGALAIVQIALGDTARALTNLESAARGRSTLFTMQSMAVPIFDPVRRSPRFRGVLNVLGVP
jgi:hypothetical protein